MRMQSNRERQISIPQASALTMWRKSSYSGGESGQCLEVSDAWRKSTYSGADGADCLEVNDAWRKSTYSGGTSGDCLEVGSAHRQVGVPVRDSKNPDGPAVLFGAPAWQAFVSYLSR